MGHDYRAEVVGSLLRPAHLLEARTRWLAGEMPAAEYKVIEDRAVDAAIATQEGAGLDVVTDGEMRRAVYLDHFRMLDGVGDVPAPPVTMRGSEPGDELLFQSPVSVTGRISQRRMITVEEYSYARARARKPIKVTLPSPLILYIMFHPEHSREAYPDPFDLFRDGAEIVLAEARELAALGCEYIQIDAPELVQVFADESQREHFRSLGIDPERISTEGVEIVNSLATVPGVRFALHMCRANHQSKWLSEGGYDEISDAFARLDNYDVFMLEYDDERSGTFAPLENLPEDKVAVLGLVSTKVDRVEDRDVIRARLREAAGYVAREQLALSTQCGFASEQSGNLISERTQQQKLALVADIAHEVWG